MNEEELKKLQSTVEFDFKNQSGYNHEQWQNLWYYYWNYSRRKT